MAKNIVNSRPVLNYVPDFSIEGGAYNIKVVSNLMIFELTEAINYTAPPISNLSTSYIYNIKNMSGGTLTLEFRNTDNIEGESIVTVYKDENFQLYISDTDTFSII